MFVVIQFQTTSVLCSNFLTKKGPGVKNIGPVHFLVFRNKAISKKKGNYLREIHFLLYQNKVIYKKKVITLRMPPSWCYYEAIEQYLALGGHVLTLFRKVRFGRSVHTLLKPSLVTSHKENKNWEKYAKSL